MSTSQEAPTESRTRAVSARGLVAAFPRAMRVVPTFVFIGLALFAAYIWVSGALGNNTIGFDFEGTVWDPALAIREGRSPYPEPTLANVEVGNPALYPPLLMVLVAPFTVLPYGAVEVLWTLVLVGSVVGALAALGVRDWRCYIVAVAAAPVVVGLTWGNATLVLLPLLALGWRWRTKTWRTGAILGVAIAVKLFLWPLVFWLLGTRRYGAAAVSAATAVGAVLVPWALFGFDGLSSYRELLRVAEEVYAVHSYSVATMLSAVGVSTHPAVYATFVVGVVGTVLAFALGRSGRDSAAYAIVILASILGSPIVWEHYYALLFVPIAIARPRFSPLWLAPLAIYVTHRLARPRLSASELEPGASGCCKPPEVPSASWVFNHAPAGLWPALGAAIVGVAIVAIAVRPNSRSVVER